MKKLSGDYTGKPYAINNPSGKTLQAGDLVIMHHPYKENDNRYAYLCKWYSGDLCIRLLEIKHYDDKQIVKVDEPIYRLLEPVHWWRGKHRTVNSPVFQALNQMLNFDEVVMSIMPGSPDPVDSLPL